MTEKTLVQIFDESFKEVLEIALQAAIKEHDYRKWIPIAEVPESVKTDYIVMAELEGCGDIPYAIQWNDVGNCWVQAYLNEPCNKPMRIMRVSIPTEVR